MTNAQHTPGPWLITNSHIENGEWVTGISSEKEDGTIALVIGSKARAGYIDESPTSEANARLIAAAPELLEALCNMVSIFEEYAEDWEENSAGVALLKSAHAAIAKATGK